MIRSLLLVHANSDDREMYAEFLASEGFPTSQASTTDEALPLLASADLVITGLLVPGSFDAVELIRWIRRNPQMAAKPVVVVTACTLSHQLERARRAGATTVLLKPCLPNVLVAEVRRVLDQPNAAPGPLAADRRQIPDRREQWRGGRRDTDWVGRPRMTKVLSTEVRAPRRWRSG